MPGYSRATSQGEEEEVAVWTMVSARGRASDLHTHSFGQSLPHKFSKCAPSNTWPVFSLTCVALGLQEAFEIRGSDSSHFYTFFGSLSPDLHFAWEKNRAHNSFEMQLCWIWTMLKCQHFFQEASFQIDTIPSQKKGTLLNVVINRKHYNKCRKH